MDFKIIAIRAFESENVKYLKSLKSGEFYKFYHDYKIDDYKIIYESSVPANFFNSAGISINISAIVGKNGSGKSTLVELLMKAINNLAHFYGYNYLWNIDTLDLELYFQFDAFYKIKFKGDPVIYKQNFNGDKFILISKTDFKLEKLFYSIVINYSLYGLNTKEAGYEWLTDLFHKNDGYQIPLVISPMRHEGIININTETELTTARLVANILTLNKNFDPEERKLTANLYPFALRLSLKSANQKMLYEIISFDKTKNPEQKIVTPIFFEDLMLNKNDLLSALNKNFNFNFVQNEEDADTITVLANQYILRKLVKIAINYPVYNKYFDQDKKSFNNDLFNEYLDLLLNKNKNHISFKLLQTLNFLRFRHIEWSGDMNLPFDFEIPVLSKKIDEVIPNKDLRIEFIPPPIFKTEIILKKVMGDDTLIEFNTLSSGEKQSIFSINSIIYHLLNLDSIENDGNLQNGYQCLNLILEEIDLYFHPELQRTFIHELLRNIREKIFKRIKAINICFVSHSPFILSDIPDSNILFLGQDGSVQNNLIKAQTFGSNIHDLLRHSFFLENGAMGEFAKEKIRNAIIFLEDEIKKPGSGDKKWNKDSVKIFINLIGETLIRESLKELYNKAFLKSIEEMEREIETLKMQINSLENNQ